MHNVFDLKLEHEILQDKVKRLRGCFPPHLRAQAVPQPPHHQQPPFGQTQAAFLDQQARTAEGAFLEDAESGAEEQTLPKKKRSKASQGVDKYVCSTCGRTDSPEWRKVGSCLLWQDRLTDA